MSDILTIRLEPGLRKQLQAAAKTSGVSESAFVRTVLRNTIASRRLSAGEKLQKVQGSLSIPDYPTDGWAGEIYKNNWRK